MSGVTHSSRRSCSGFQTLADAFLAGAGLPFAEVLSAERIERVFARHGNLFGIGAIDSTAVIVWAFLGQYDHLIVWTRPARPDGMDETTCAAIPERLELRELSFRVVEAGRRTRTLTIITTLTGIEQFPKEAIAELYGFRWHVELDLRSIKVALGLDHVRCKSPEMVRRELWTTLLAYNLIRTTAAAALHEKRPRQISFTGTCQSVLAGWRLEAGRRSPADR